LVCLASEPGPHWDGTSGTAVSPADDHPSLFAVIEMCGCSGIRFGGPGDEAISGHPLHGKGLSGYEAHEVDHLGFGGDSRALTCAAPVGPDPGQ
jgi:hypothetical protein